MIDKAIYDALKRHAIDALPDDDDDYGSDRQVDAQCQFFALFEMFVGCEFDNLGCLSSWCFKATEEEKFARMLRFCEWISSKRVRVRSAVDRNDVVDYAYMLDQDEEDFGDPVGVPHIESTATWSETTKELGAWYLMIGNQEYHNDELIDLEDTLFDYCVREAIVDVPDLVEKPDEDDDAHSALTEARSMAIRTIGDAIRTVVPQEHQHRFLHPDYPAANTDWFEWPIDCPVGKDTVRRIMRCHHCDQDWKLAADDCLVFAFG